MNYNILYSKFIESRPIRTKLRKDCGKGLEIHHIIPRSIGGTNDKQGSAKYSENYIFKPYWD